MIPEGLDALSTLLSSLSRAFGLRQPQDHVAVALTPASHRQPVDVPASKPDVALALLVAMWIMF
jgi:hypothetical protein